MERQAPGLLPRGASVPGRYEGVAVRDGFGLALTDRRYEEQSDYRDHVDDHLKIHFKLSGRSFIHGEGQEAQSVEAGAVSFLVQPAQSLKFEHIPAETNEQSLTLMCSRDFVSDILTASVSDLPRSISDYLKAQVARFSYASMPMLPQSRVIVEDILNCRPADPMSRLLMESRSLELLYLTIDQLRTTNASAITLRSKDRRKVEQLCELLQLPEAANLTIPELCRRVAWNETQMMECFKSVTGTTISHYRYRQRMDRAMRQLRETEDPIIEVAFEAGYEHASNFATAFRRMFGYPPTSVRKGRVSLTSDSFNS